MRASVPHAPNHAERANCREVIERFLDRSWVSECQSVQTVRGHRFVLGRLDDWLQLHRHVTLCNASARDVRALLKSTHWDSISHSCESLLTLVARFYQNLRDCRFRPDDPIETIIDRALAQSLRQRNSSRPLRRETGNGSLLFSRSPVL